MVLFQHYGKKSEKKRFVDIVYKNYKLCLGSLSFLTYDGAGCHTDDKEDEDDTANDVGT